jgi:hypothetical protein
MGIVAFVLFFLAGLGFGYAAPSWPTKFIPIAFPLVLALPAFARDGISAGSLVRLIVALLLTVAGIAVGRMLELRESRGSPASA